MTRREFILGIGAFALAPALKGSDWLKYNSEKVVAATLLPENQELAKILRLGYLARNQQNDEISMNRLENLADDKALVDEYLQKALDYKIKSFPEIKFAAVNEVEDDLCSKEFAYYDFLTTSVTMCPDLVREKFMYVYAHELTHHAERENNHVMVTIGKFMDEGLATTVAEAAVFQMQKDTGIKRLSAWPEMAIYQNLLDFDEQANSLEYRLPDGKIDMNKIDPHAFGTAAMKIMQVKYGEDVYRRIFHYDLRDLDKFLGL